MVASLSCVELGTAQPQVVLDVVIAVVVFIFVIKLSCNNNIGCHCVCKVIFVSNPTAVNAVFWLSRVVTTSCNPISVWPLTGLVPKCTLPDGQTKHPCYPALHQETASENASTLHF